jgi:hypothetical protein
MRWAFVLVMAACGSKPTPVVKSQPTMKVEPAAPACIKPLEDETLAITNAVAAGTSVEYCIGAKRDQCFRLDTASGAFTRLAEPPKQDTLTTAHVETTNPRLEICQVEGCKALTAKVLPASAQIRAATNSTGTVAVFLLGDAPAGKGYAEVWDVPAQKKLATFKYARGEFKCGDVSMIEDTILLSTAQCDAPAARATLYSLKGRRIANVGGNDYGVYGNAHAPVDAHVWAFLEENGAELVIQDVVKGKVLKKIDTSALFLEAGAQMGNPGESALVRIGPGQLAVIGGAPATGHVAVIDVDNGTVKVIKANVCR